MNALAPLILLVEDEPQMRRFIRASLTLHGYRLVEAERADEVVALTTSHHPALILMDLGLPGGDGLDLTRSLREWSGTPILVLSARGREDDKVAALDAGADDYLTKPFGINELLARIRVALRHAERMGVEPPALLDHGELQIDLVRRRVTLAGAEVHLTPTEYRLLVLLAQNGGKVLTHRQILKEVWGPAYASQNHYVRVHVAELRKKIEREPARPRMLLTEPGVGYRFRESGGDC